MATKSTLKLPRLRTKDELLKVGSFWGRRPARRGLLAHALAVPMPAQTSPELCKLLGEDSDDGKSLSPFIAPAPATKAPPRPGLPAVKTKGPGSDTPRGLGEEELTEEELLRLELEKIKNERQVLLDSIKLVKAQAGEAARARSALQPSKRPPMP